MACVVSAAVVLTAFDGLDPTAAAARTLAAQADAATKTAQVQPVATRPDVVSAAVSARAQGSRVEVESMRTETSSTWVEASGLLTTEATAAPVRFKDSAGAWRDIDLSLQRSADGSIAAKSHKLGLRLGKRLGTAGGVFASAEAGTGRQVEWLSPWPLPEPTIEGTDATTARYADVQPGVDLVLDSRRSGFEQDFVIKSRPASAPVWRIPLRTKGLTAESQADGSIRFVDSKGTVHSQIPVADMWDAVTDPASGDPVNRTKVNVTVEQQSASQATLVIAPDPAWLLARGRVFPVTVDPTYAQWTNYTSFDTFVQSDLTTDQSSSTELRLGSSNNGTTKARTYLNFSLDPSRDKKIRSASLNLWETYSSSCTPSTFQIKSSGTASTATRWTAQPTVSATVSGSLQVAKGFSASCPGGKVTVPITSLVQTWSTWTSASTGLELNAANENDSASLKKFHSSDGAYPPNVLFTYDRPPSQTTAPQFASAVSYAPPSGSSTLYTPYPQPSVSSTASDADANLVRYFFEFHDSMTVSGTSLKASCGSVAVASGTRAGCQPVGNLPDNTQLYVRSRAGDMDTGGNVMLFGNWSGWTPVRTAGVNPPAPSVSCPAPYSNSSWQDIKPAANVTCTVSVTTTGSSFNVPGYFRLTVDNKPVATNFTGGQPGQIKVTPPFTGGTASTTVTVSKDAGLHSISAISQSPSGRLSSATGYSFGYGGTALSAPVVEPRITTTGGVKIAAAGPPKGSSSTPTAQVRWRVSGYDRDNSELVGWNTATSAPLTVTDNGAAGVSATGIWDAAAETTDAQLDSDPNTAGIQPTTLNSRVPVLLDVQVCLTYTSATQCTWSEQHVSVLRVPHAFGNGFPTADAGPGQVALWTGEFNMDATDIDVPGYTGSISLSRSHATYAGATDTVNGIFGPGWTAQLDGADAGAAGMQVIDSTRIDGTIALVDGDGSALVWEPPNGQRRTATTPGFQIGTWTAADEDTDLDGSRLTISGTGTSTVLSYIEDDGTITTWKITATPTGNTDAVFRPDGIAEPGVSSKTTYSYDGAGRVSRILAPAPPGVTCSGAGTLNPGCRALDLEYGTSGPSNGKLIKAWLKIYNPDLVGPIKMDSIQVAAYTYDANTRLATATDPRSGLATSYTYNTDNTLATLTPPGQTPYQFNYVTADGRKKLGSVTRQRPTGDPTGGTATLASYVYDVPLSGAGLPDLTANSVARWNQAKAPTHGYAVFGPDHPAPTTPGATDWPYANLQYTDNEGYTVNTAAYGAGDWQYTATDYNTQGNTIRELDERALRLVIDGQVATGAVDQYASLTVYNPDILGAGNAVVTPAGTLVTDTYGPARNAALANGTVMWVRPHTKTVFDQGAPTNGINPDTTQPYRLPTTETTYAYDPGTATNLETISQTLTDYAAPVANDTDGWTRGLPGKVTTDVDLNGTVSTGDIVKLTRYDAEGRAVETRQPASNGADAGTTTTVYYTTAANTNDPSCGTKPQWAGQVCKTRPAAAPASQAGQPATPSLPGTETTGFTYLLAPTTQVETSGSVTRTTTTSYDTAGRPTSSVTAVTGLAGSTPNTKKETTYNATTGLPTVVTARNADTTVAGTITTGYDGWGRTISYQPSGETATTTVYDAAGSVATVTDANGTTSYTYDGTDANGNTERRGLATRVDVTVGAQTWTSRGGYDADSTMITQKLPGGLTQTTAVDNTGEPTGLTYTGQVTTVNEDNTTTVDPNGPWLGWSQDNDTTGRVAREWTPLVTAFTGPPTGSDPNDPGDAKPYDRSYTYDPAGRLTQVRDRTAAPGVDPTDPTLSPCETRSYNYDRNDNRVSKTTAGVASGPCATTGGTATTRAFDTADRPTTGANSTGTYTYDLLGRTTTLPAADAPVSTNGDITLAYYDNDLAKSITQAGTTTSYTLDAADRRATETITAATPTMRHYTDTDDNPTWVTQGTTWQRYAELIGSDLALTVNNTGAANLTLANSHGDIVTTVSLPSAGAAATAIDGWNNYDEFGGPSTTNTASTGALKYGWLGAKQRASTGAQLLLMGVRLFNPTTGLFTTTDPVAGGGANQYAYPSDPVNSFDLDGRKWWRKALKWGAVAAGVAGALACGASIVCGIAVGAAVGAASYAASHAGTRSWSWGGFGRSAAIGGASGAFWGGGARWAGWRFQGGSRFTGGWGVRFSHRASARGTDFLRNGSRRFAIHSHRFARRHGGRWWKFVHYHHRGKGGIGRHRPWQRMPSSGGGHGII